MGQSPDEILQGPEAYALLASCARRQAVIMLDPEGVVRAWNPGAQTLFGYAPEEMLGKSAAILFTPEDRADDRPAEELRRAAEEGASFDDRWHLRKDGARFFCAGTTTAMREPDGTLVGFGKIVSDLTEEMTDKRWAELRMKLADRRVDILENENRDARQELSRRFDRLREQASILDLAHDAIVVRDLRGVISFWNAGAERMYGWRADEAIGRNSYELLQTRLPQPLAEIELTLVEQSYWEGELSHRTRDGREIVVNSRWAINSSEGPEYRVLDISTDVTERRRAEEELERSRHTLETMYQELLVANEAKRRFLATVSHELRTPLNAIIGFSEVMLAADCDALKAETRRQYLEHIRNAGDHLLGLVEQILELSRIEAGKLELHREPLSVASLVRSSAQLMHVAAAAANVTLEIGRCDDATISGDPLRLRQILYNLLSNAIKFTASGGRVELRSTVDGGAALIEVSDTGIGIDEDDLERIFRPFEKNPVPAHERQGAGIGLSITRELVEAHGGTLEVRSKPGEGSTFTVRLPLA